MRFDTLLSLIKRGQVTRDSVVRGPTTWQLWKRASEVKGLSREFGLCYFCGAQIGSQTNLCPQCNRLQEPPANPDVLVDARAEASTMSAELGAPTPAAGAPPPSPLPVPAPPPAPASAAVSSFSAPAPAAAPPPPRNTASQRPPRPSRPSVPAFDEPPTIEMSAAGTMGDVEDLLAVTEEQEALARQITGRAPVQSPAPMPSPARSSPRPPRNLPPARPRQDGPDDALLTPQELATAFQLNFGPSAPANGQPRSRRRRHPLRAAFAILLLIGLGVAALLYLRPDLRAKASAWSEQTVASVKEFIASRTSPQPARPPAAPTRPPNGAGGTSPASQAPRSRPSQPVVIVPPSAPPPRPVAVSDGTPKTLVTPAPAKAADAAQVATGTVKADALPKAEALPPVPPVPPPAAAPPPQAPPAPPQRTKRQFTSITEAYDEEKRLWSKAIDAEANQDFVEAVRCYEEIEQLPREVHPPALSVRLELARRQVK
jgi:hypothetical protein